MKEHLAAIYLDTGGEARYICPFYMFKKIGKITPSYVTVVLSFSDLYTQRLMRRHTQTARTHTYTLHGSVGI